MLSIRKLAHVLVSRSALSCPFVGSSCNTVRVIEWKLHAYWRQSFCGHFIGSSLNNLQMQPAHLDSRNGLAQPLQFLSTVAGTLLVQARDPAKLCMELENAIEEHRFEDTWSLYEQHMRMDGFPRRSVLNKILSSFAQSLDLQWLERAYGIVEKAFEENKSNLLEKETLIYLSFGLSKCGLAAPASTILRKLVELEQFPPVTAWSAIVAHMSQKAPGVYLAADLILEIGYLFQDGRIDPRKKKNAPLIAMKPNTVVFNIVLAGCLLFGTTRKADQLLDMMPRVGVKVDAALLVIMAHIYERNGHMDELKKLQRHVNECQSLTDKQFREFYNCLLSCHLKFGDLDSASQMVLEMLSKAKKAQNCLASARLAFRVSGKGISNEKSEVSENSCSVRSPHLSYEEFSRDQIYTKLEVEAKEILETLLAKLHTQVEFLTTKCGILLPTDKMYVKLVKAFLEAGKTRGLAEFLIRVEKEDLAVSVDDSALVQVINSCILLGWLDQAHDLLDEMRLAGVKIGSSVYGSLLKAYIKANRAGEVTALLRDARKAGIHLDSSCYEAIIQSRVVQEDTWGGLNLFKEMNEAKLHRPGNKNSELLVKGCEEGGEARLMEKLLHEIKEGQTMDGGVHDWNNVIHFFSKKRLMEDAHRALKRMRSLGFIPNAQTFHSMVTGYAAIGGKYAEVTELWVEMKSLAKTTPLKFDQELLDSVLYTFVRGGFFSMANEVVALMEKGKMFVDKFKYRTLFLKYHKTLCKGKASKYQTEEQASRREAVITFKNWVGLF